MVYPQALNHHQQLNVVYFGLVKKLLMEGMISGVLLRTNFLRVCSAYFSPSEKFSSTPAALVSLLTFRVDADVAHQLKPANSYSNTNSGEQRINLGPQPSIDRGSHGLMQHKDSFRNEREQTDGSRK
uniref:Uncharacterized protein n=1 Tax=Nelumbo nucifera TaxID=4432 RepID=A0A822YFX6_NELNU|nr:TPA_asm: hypothetical protein HUJ06_009925 [Nelumbo nucifera]